MAILTEEMKQMVATQQCFVGTADKEGNPNVAPKRSTRVLDDNTLMFVEGTAKHTYQNLLQNPRVAIAVVNREVLDGYRFIGTAEILESGPIYDAAAEMSTKAGLPKPKAVARVTVQEIYSLKPGPTAGTKIG
ncbi:MAG: pyridoxamine 5'-phosphate oxidase family protein [Bacillota bacterium]